MSGLGLKIPTSLTIEVDVHISSDGLNLGDDWHIFAAVAVSSGGGMRICFRLLPPSAEVASRSRRLPGQSYIHEGRCLPIFRSAENQIMADLEKAQRR